MFCADVVIINWLQQFFCGGFELLTQDILLHPFFFPSGWIHTVVMFKVWHVGLKCFLRAFSPPAQWRPAVRAPAVGHRGCRAGKEGTANAFWIQNQWCAVHWANGWITAFREPNVPFGVFRWGSVRQFWMRRQLWERHSQMLLSASVEIHFCFEVKGSSRTEWT